MAWVDHQRIAMVGFRLPPATWRPASPSSSRSLRTVVCIGAGINQVFTNQEMFARCPRMMRDGLANRLGADAAQWDLLRTASGLPRARPRDCWGVALPCRY